MAVKNFKDLIAWQKAMDLVEMVYRLTSGFPVDERFGLTSQLRRAVVSIPSNIASDSRTARNAAKMGHLWTRLRKQFSAHAFPYSMMLDKLGE